MQRPQPLHPPYRSDELPPVYPSAGCTPAEPASVSTGKCKIIERKSSGKARKIHLKSDQKLSERWG